MRRPGPASKGAERYVVGEIERFDQKDNALLRAAMEPELAHLKEFYDILYPKETRGYRLEDLSIAQAGWYAEQAFAMGNMGGNRGLLSWESPKIFYSDFRPPPDAGLEANDPLLKDPSQMTRTIKKVARLYGASLVGVCKLDRRWLYSNRVWAPGFTYEPIEIPENYQYVISMGFEMKYDLFKFLPSYAGVTATTTTYGRLALTTGSVAQFIRYLGYKAIPMGNDTALSIPIAIDAGLGELSRMGLLITPQYGPRFRLSKIFTDLPLAPDIPIEFGVWDFCTKCQRCADLCPGQAITRGEATDQINNISNRKGMLRWPLDAEKCLGWLAKSHTFCGNCVLVCPFNKPSGMLHDWVRWGIKNTSWMDSFFIKMDKWLGYGSKTNPKDFWDL